MTPLCVVVALLAAMIGGTLSVVVFAACVVAGRVDARMGLDE